MAISKLKKIETYDNFTTEKVDVIQNNLLGDYNAKGKYVINKKIVNELVELKKIKKESYNNAIFVIAKTQTGKVIEFQIDYKKNTNSNLATGVLSTLEPVEKQGGRLTNVIKTPIAKYTNTLTPDFIDRTLEAFNVIFSDDEGGREKKDTIEDAYIIKRNMLLKALDKLTADNYNVIYEDYFTQRINLLKQTNNAYSKKILAIFNEEFNKVSDYFLLDKKSKKITNYKAMNELLDKAFEDLSGLENYAEQEKQYRERILPILGMFITSAERVEKTAQKQVLDTFPKKTKEALTDTLVDIKQAQESVDVPDIPEKNTQILKEKIDKKLDDIVSKLDGPKPEPVKTASLVDQVLQFRKSDSELQKQDSNPTPVNKSYNSENKNEWFGNVDQNYYKITPNIGGEGKVSPLVKNIIVDKDLKDSPYLNETTTTTGKEDPIYSRTEAGYSDGQPVNKPSINEIRDRINKGRSMNN